MKALAYLIVTQLKNRILYLKKKPAFLFLYGFIIFMIIFLVVMSAFFDQESQKIKFADERIIYLIIAALGILLLSIFISSGLSTGSTLFSMSDVGLLFVAPISSKKILMYGLISTLGKSLLGAIFIFYQIGTLKTNFGYGLKEILNLFIVYVIMIMTCQLLSIGIYIYSNGNQYRKNLVKTVSFIALGTLLLTALLISKQNQVNVVEAALSMVESKWFGFVPITGWATMFFIGVTGGSLSYLIISLALFLTTGILIVSLLTHGSADYYEDVLLSTEITYQTKSAAKEGRNYPQRSRKKIKVRNEDPGIQRGSGAMTFAYKHILEMRRKSRFIFIDAYTIFTSIVTGIAGYNFRNMGGAGGAEYGLLAFIIYIQYFLTMMGKLKIELIKPYIYLIPEKSLKKVFAASVTSLIKPCVDAVCMFTVLAVVGGADLLTCIFFMLAYSASGAVFVGMTILFQRVLGGQPNKLIQTFIGLSLLLAIMSPAIGASVAAAFLLPETLDFLCMLPYTIFCFSFAALMFVTCGNLIDKVEYTGKF